MLNSKTPKPSTDAPADFDFGEQAKTFDGHVRSHLPWYELTTDLVKHLVRAYLPEGGRVIDIGASNGNIARALSKVLEERGADMLSIDRQPEMIERFSGPGTALCERVQDVDLPSADVIISHLSLMFLPPADRGPVLAKLQNRLKPGGVLLAFERVIAPSSYIGHAIERAAIAAKLEAGMPPSDIVAKKTALLGVQRPLQYETFAGWTPIFRYGAFAGFAWERPSSLI